MVFVHNYGICIYRCKVIPENDNCTRILSGKYYYVPNAVDTNIFDLVKNINIFDSIKDNEACTTFYNGVLCFYNFPPCEPDTFQLLPLCPGRCEEIHRLFEFCGELVNFIVVTLNCSDPISYYGNIPVDINVSTATCSKSQIY